MPGMKRFLNPCIEELPVLNGLPLSKTALSSHRLSLLDLYH